MAQCYFTNQNYMEGPFIWYVTCWGAAYITTPMGVLLLYHVLKPKPILAPSGRIKEIEQSTLNTNHIFLI